MRAKDIRNLYLAREGVVFPDSTKAAGMHPIELSRRHQSLENEAECADLDLWVTDGVLKQAGLIARKREPLEKDVVAEKVESTRWKEAEGKVPVGARKMPRVVQSKILATKDRIDYD
ncbi:hypothetical protein BJ742DRAFT_735553 [Cladochytrium replicatum]|nr:hypothetical protein BJ742DRAFT_735553 [Cladochytrium replicatum]